MTVRNIALALGAFAAGATALAVGAVALATRRGDGEGGTQPNPAPRSTTPDIDNSPNPHAQQAPTGLEGHAASDLAQGQPLGPDHRAPDAFRPDINAPMTPAEREALRPATGSPPSLVSEEGGTVQGVGGDRY